MRRYSKIKRIQPELKRAECPVCKGPSIAEHYPDGYIFTWTCPVCQALEKPKERKEIIET